MTTPYDRRIEDKKQEAKLQAELDAMVAAENDPSKRATLMVLNAINRSLNQNTLVTHTVKDQLTDLKTEFQDHVLGFARHAKDEEALLNKGRGAWMALAWFLGVVQIAVGFAINYTWETQRSQELQATTSQIAIQTLGVRVTNLENKK